MLVKGWLKVKQHGPTCSVSLNTQRKPPYTTCTQVPSYNTALLIKHDNAGDCGMPSLFMVIILMFGNDCGLVSEMLKCYTLKIQ